MKQCRFLELPKFGSNFTDQALSITEQCSIRELKEKILQADKQYTMSHAEDHQSQKFVSQVYSWMTVWDFALNFGVDGTTATLSILDCPALVTGCVQLNIVGFKSQSTRLSVNTSWIVTVALTLNLKVSCVYFYSVRSMFIMLLCFFMYNGVPGLLIFLICVYNYVHSVCSLRILINIDLILTSIFVWCIASLMDFIMAAILSLWGWVASLVVIAHSTTTELSSSDYSCQIACFVLTVSVHFSFFCVTYLRV